MQFFDALSIGLKLTMKFFFFSSSFIQPGSGIHAIKPKGYRTIGEDQEVLDSDEIPHIVSSDVWLKVFPHSPEILPSLIQLNYEKGTVIDILMPEE